MRQGGPSRRGQGKTGLCQKHQVALVQSKPASEISSVNIGGIMMKKIVVGFIGLVLFVASARAASSVLEGFVKDAKGHAIEGADIRMETKNGGKLLTTVKTDVNGRYFLDGLPAGNYRITLIVHGAIKSSINN